MYSIRMIVENIALVRDAFIGLDRDSVMDRKRAHKKLPKTFQLDVDVATFASVVHIVMATLESVASVTTSDNPVTTIESVASDIPVTTVTTSVNPIASDIPVTTVTTSDNPVATIENVASDIPVTTVTTSDNPVATIENVASDIPVTTVTTSVNPVATIENVASDIPVTTVTTSVNPIAIDNPVNPVTTEKNILVVTEKTLDNVTNVTDNVTHKQIELWSETTVEALEARVTALEKMIAEMRYPKQSTLNRVKVKPARDAAAPGNYKGYTVNYVGGKYRLVRRVNGKLRAIYVGTVWSEEKADAALMRWSEKGTVGTVGTVDSILGVPA